MVSRKIKDWSYEKEWRLIMGIGELAALNKTPVDYTKHPIFEQPSLGDLMNSSQIIPILKPSAIYLGINMEEKIRDILISKAEQNNISVYQMEASTTGLKYSNVV